MNKLKIINGKILTPNKMISGTIYIESGQIREVSEGNLEIPDAFVIDAEGCYVSPGFIDIHTHGAGNHDFMDGSLEAYLQIAETHVAYGTTSLYPTTLASTMEELEQTFSVYKEAKIKNKKGASFMGLHLEGPYFSMNQRGAQDPKYIRNPDKEEYLMILKNAEHIARWSSAPELEGSKEFAETLRSFNILPAIGHSDAIYEEVVEAYKWGYTHVTHLYSCTSGVTRRNALRYAGVIEASYLIPDMTVEIIADGVHLPASLLKLVYQIKGAEKIALITDSMRAAGMPDGPSILGSLKNGQPVIVEEGVAKLPDRSAFAGSVATANRLVRIMHSSGEVPLLDTIQMITSTPAKIMGVEKTKGSLSKGKDADIVIFNKNIDIKVVIINGELILNNF
ncbi:MAG: N-acetylglucosamine-6-phosphate deacetylase [Tannerella sp.]|jgi:N-acetylglucosamine-6-phosphate deacetylase|nr:N-acetylglucosamine-6-phosphate deacetylase [Tannerella sp.]